MSDGDQIVETQKAVATALGVSANQVSTWKKRGMPRLPDGRFDLAAIRAWRKSNMQPGRRVAGSLHDLQKEKLEEEIRLKREQATIANLKRLEMEAQLIPVETAENIIATRAAFFAKAVGNVGRALAPRLVGMDMAEIQDAIESDLRRILEQMARTGRLPEPGEVAVGD